MRCPSLAMFLGAGCLAVGCEGRKHYEVRSIILPPLSPREGSASHKSNHTHGSS